MGHNLSMELTARAVASVCHPGKVGLRIPPGSTPKRMPRPHPTLLQGGVLPCSVSCHISLSWGHNLLCRQRAQCGCKLQHSQQTLSSFCCHRSLLLLWSVLTRSCIDLFHAFFPLPTSSSSEEREREWLYEGCPHMGLSPDNPPFVRTTAGKETSAPLRKCLFIRSPLTSLKVYHPVPTAAKASPRQLLIQEAGRQGAVLGSSSDGSMLLTASHFSAWEAVSFWVPAPHMGRPR